MKKSTLFACLFYSLVDYLAFLVVTALFTPLVLMPKSPFQDPLGLIETPELLLGCILGSYGLGLLIGSPLFGRLSDSIGRKPVLQLSMVAFVIGNLGVGYFSAFSSAWMVILFRFLTGFGSSGAQLLFNVIDDLEEDEQKKGRAMGFLVAVSAFSTIVGPAFGAYFAGDQGYELGMPFFILAFMGLIAMLMIQFSYPKNGVKKRASAPGFFQLLNKPSILILCLAFFFMILNIESLFVAIPILMVSAFGVDSFWIALFFAFGGIVATLTGIFIIPWVTRFFRPRLAFLVSLFGLLLSNFFFLLTSTPQEVYIPFTFFAITAIIAWAKGNELAVLIPQKKDTGSVMGIFGSLIALALLVSSLLIGYTATIDPLLPLIVLDITALVAFLATFVGYPLLQKKDL
jgi:predicted MFS family arabinose efflux permease